MKKIILLSLVVLFVLMSVIAVSAFDQNGNDTWCNSDADGCWVTGEAGEKVYIMFWTEASREKFMGRGSSAPLGTLAAPGKVFLQEPDKGRRPGKGSCLSWADLEGCILACKGTGSDSCVDNCIDNSCIWQEWPDVQ